MIDLKSQVNSIIQSHVGSTNPIKAKRLTEMVGLKDDREVRQVIRELIAEGIPIASSGNGYFIADNFSQIAEYVAVERSRIVENALRVRDIKKAFGNYWQGNRQTRLM